MNFGKSGMWRAVLTCALATSALTTATKAAPLASWQAPSQGSGDPAVARQIAGLGDFIDGVVAQQLREREVAGAVVVVVHQGKVIVSRGYGWADVDRGVRVDPARTLFRPGSVSKLVTWTALMQLVEQGKVSLDADVNRYLDYKIPARDGKPILVRDLLDHRPGYDERGGITVDDDAKYEPLAQWMPKNMPNRVRPAGTESAYSNYGSAIGGYIVERVAKMPFEEYVQKNIFGPLGMTQSSFLDPTTPERLAMRAEGYQLENGRFIKKPMEYYQNIAPAGSIFAPGEDMAKFMIAHLNAGKYGTAQILKPETVRMMHKTRSANVPGFPGFASGFMVLREAGPHIIGHGGNTTDFHSQMTLVPEAGFGFFVSYTGGEQSNQARSEIANALVGRVFPMAPGPRWTGPSAQVAGRYLTNRRDYAATPGAGAYTVVEAAGNHAITIARGTNAKTYWQQVAADTFEQVTGAADGGPYERVKFFTEGGERKMGFTSQPHILHRLTQ